jgi:ParB/RepB/Spo0J family partition protein
MSTTITPIPLADIITSRSNRTHFDPAKLAELAESIRAKGVDTPVIVRPLPGSRVEETAYLDPRPSFELVTGERRYRASMMAGVKTIPAIVRAMTDSEAIDTQLVENLQREDLQAMDEAEGYQRLMTTHEPPLSPAQIGERISKSRTHVYNRLKLLGLCSEVRQALQAGQIQTAVAEQIARIPDTRVQAQALGNVVNAMTGEALSVREARGLIQRQYMLRLTEAPFRLDEQVKGMETEPACNFCQRRTGADPDLFADLGTTDLCLDLHCFKAKVSAHQAQQLEAARASGATIIEGREAREIIAPTGDGRIDGYLRLDDPRDAPGKGSKTLRHAIGDLMEAEGIKATLVVDPASMEAVTIAVLDTATATRLLAAKGQQEQAAALQTKAKTSAKAAADLQQQKDRDRFEDAWRWRVMERAWAKIRDREEGMYSVPPHVIWRLAIERVPTSKAKAAKLAEFLGLGTVGPIEAINRWIDEQDDKDRALALLLMFEAVNSWATSTHNDTVLILYPIASDRGIDIDAIAIRAEVEAEHKAEIEARKDSLPLPPAAQANGVRGDEAKGKGKTGAKGKGKNAPAAPAVPKLTPEDALLGIAAAMQGNEAGADCGPEGADPAGCAGGDDGRATSPDAGASDTGSAHASGLVDEAISIHPGRKVQVNQPGSEHHKAIGIVQHRSPKSADWPAESRVWVVDVSPYDDVMFTLVDITERHLVAIATEAEWPFPGAAA